MSVESTATVIGDFAIALSFLVALGFGAAQVRTAARDRRERLTLTTIRGFQTREIAEHFQRLNSRDMPATRKELESLPAEEQVEIIHYAQEMEMLGLLVYDGIIELELVERTLGDFVVYSWIKYKPFTMDRRSEDPYLNEYFEWLSKRLEDRMNSNPRPPAYVEVNAPQPQA